MRTIGGVLLSFCPSIVPNAVFEYLKVGGGDFMAYPAAMDPDFALPVFFPPAFAPVESPFEFAPAPPPIVERLHLSHPLKMLLTLESLKGAMQKNEYLLKFILIK